MNIHLECSMHPSFGHKLRPQKKLVYLLRLGGIGSVSDLIQMYQIYLR